MFIVGDTLDDLLRKSFTRILRRGTWVAATRGENKELPCIVLKLTNPLARLSHTEKRGKLFSALGELAWYLACSNDGAFISYYIDRYKDETEDDGTVHGAYGPRLFGYHEVPQFFHVINLLRTKPPTRKAVIQIFDAADLRGDYKDVPCTCLMQFLLRSGRLDLSVVMRSNDAYIGLPHDVFCFTMLQELATRCLGCELGAYYHYAGSLHIYKRHIGFAREYIAEGWQDREVAAMPEMPAEDPFSAVRSWLDAEAAIRAGGILSADAMGRLGDYWSDLVRLLEVFKYRKNGNRRRIARIKREMKASVYREYIDQILNKKRE
jgi:thymidylate synthase